MGPLVNPFLNNDFLTMASLTEAMVRLPYNTYNRVTQLGIFSEESIATTVALIEEMGGVLTLLPTAPRGADFTVNNIGKRKMRPFTVPHIPLNDVVLPSEVQGIREFGTTNEFRTLASLTVRKLASMKAKHDQTLEWMRVGALKGVLLDADGTTVIFNFFTEFGFTAQVMNFNFSNTALDVTGALLNVKRYIEDHLHSDMMTGVHALCAPDFYNALTSHPKVQTAFQYFSTNQRLGGDYRTGFEYGGVIFEEYRGTAQDVTGTAHQFIPNGTCQFFPMGTTSTFRTYFAPADFEETVNTLGLPYYAKQEPRKFGRGIDIHTQSNPLPICLRPELLVQGTIT